MKNIKLLTVAVIILPVFAFTVFKTINWRIKNDYSVRTGIYEFKGLKATIVFDEESPERSKIAAFIDARTISTGNALQDAHAREALDTDKFPMITFISTAVAKSSTGYEALGNLTLKDVTKKIKIPFTFDSKKASAQFPFIPKETFKGLFTITPKDFNVTRVGTPNQVTIELIIPVTH